MAKYDAFSREELIDLLIKQDKELALKKYGLVWDSEKEPEQVVINCAKRIPVLKVVLEKGIKTNDDDYNVMIEGDNYHALQVLNYTHKEKIDVIYIDPPYNTGKDKEWKYNDKFVNKEDGYRHSKWLTFMEKRLELAKELLTENGVIFISIDDNEQANLKLLCDKIFGENNFIALLTIENNPKGRKNSKYISGNSEYCLIYAKNTSNKSSYFIENIPKANLQKDNDGNFFTPGKRVLVGKSSNVYVSNLKSEKHYSVYYNKELNDIKFYQENDCHEQKSDLIKEGYKRYISQLNNKFLENTYTKNTLQNLFDHNALIFKKDTIYEKDFNAFSRMKSLIINDVNKDIDLKTETANSALEDMGLSFPNPKNVKYIKLLFSLLPKKDLVILDFFAGSGTTAQAVLELNKKDKGNRKFIICTNNEGNIAAEVCYPRIQKIIQGYNKNSNGEFVSGLGGNLKYFKTDFVENLKNATQTKINLAKECSEMICLKTGNFNEFQYDSPSFKIFSNNKNNKFTCIYFDCFDVDMQSFISEIKKLHGEKELYVFSLTDIVDASLFKDIPDVKIEAIPYKILDLYRRITKNHIKGINND